MVGSDGRRLHANDAAQAILGDLLGPADEASLMRASRWELVDDHGQPVANDALPAEITRTTGIEIDDRVLGFRGKSRRTTLAAHLHPPAVRGRAAASRS